MEIWKWRWPYGCLVEERSKIARVIEGDVRARWRQGWGFLLRVRVSERERWREMGG